MLDLTWILLGLDWGWILFGLQLDWTGSVQPTILYQYPSTSPSSLYPLCSIIFPALVAESSIWPTSADKGDISWKMKRCTRSRFALRRLVPSAVVNQTNNLLVWLQYVITTDKASSLRIINWLKHTKCCSDSTPVCLWEVVEILHAVGNSVAVSAHYLNSGQLPCWPLPSNSEDEIWNK